MPSPMEEKDGRDDRSPKDPEQSQQTPDLTTLATNKKKRKKSELTSKNKKKTEDKSNESVNTNNDSSEQETTSSSSEKRKNKNKNKKKKTNSFSELAQDSSRKIQKYGKIIQTLDNEKEVAKNKNWEVYVSPTTIQAAVHNTLEKLKNSVQHVGGKTPLFEEENIIQLSFVWNPYSKGPYEYLSVNPRRIKLPHGLWNDTKEFCIFVKDPRSEIKKKFEKDGIKGKVLDLQKLRSRFNRFEQRRQLAKSYDLFLYDARILKSLPRLLGKSFYYRNKMPVEVDVTKPRPLFKKRIYTALNSSYLVLRKTRSLVKIGTDSFSEEELVENCIAAIKSVVAHLPKGFQGWNGIQAIYLTNVEKKIVLPLYITLPQVPRTQLASALHKENYFLTQLKRRKNPWRSVKITKNSRAKKSSPQVAKQEEDQAQKVKKKETKPHAHTPDVKKQKETKNETNPSPKQKEQAHPKKVSEFVPPSKDLLDQQTKPEKATKEKVKPVQRNKFKRTALNEFIETGANVYSKLAPKNPPKREKKIGRRPK